MQLRAILGKRSIATAFAVLAVTAATLPAAAQQKPPACTGLTPAAFVLAAPTDGSTSIPIDFKTIYVAVPAKALASLPAAATERVLLVDDLGATTEGGVLHPSTRDDLPNDLPNISTPATADVGDLAYSYTWVPGLRASTHYTAVLARLDENNCVFARLGEFTTGNGGAL